ncbi:MAG TPA: asparagine synthase (glutamine-hydrolyzing) [Chitinophagaceae bacterium]|nr:asparagine synthase (glutamine-hydrolyzing) [Chitinophagaceae bacterium]
MCGIAGIIQTNPSRFNKAHLKKMTYSLAHRGPDGEGCWQNDSGNVLLGNRRLSIIDLSSAGDQPIHYLSRYSIVHNGEIYNYIELREALQKKGYSFRSQTDTEVIAAAYDHWGDACVDHFDGMFAFAAWDEKKKALFIARDRFGEKPLFFYYDDEKFLFASEMKALWAAGVEKIPNRKMLFNFLTIGYTDNPDRPEETFYENITKLPAASILKFSLLYFNYSIESYWDIDPAKQNKAITDEEAIEQFTDLFTTSVKRRLRSDVAIGTSLSGGLDSSAVVAVINELQTINYRPQTFTASFPNFEKDELAWAKQVAEQYELQQHIVNVSANELLTDWQKLCYHQEEPFGSASIYAQYKVYELAGRNNIKVLLDGQGADETLAGYHKYYKWYWQELFRRSSLNKSKELAAARQLGINEPFIYKNKIAAWFPSFASIVMERQYLLKALRHDGLEKEFVREHSKEAYYTPPDHFNLNGVLYFNTCIHGLEELLRYADRNSMAHGSEVRLPFLSHELVEFIFSLPPHFKIRNGWTKWLLRETMKNKLPGNIVWRKDKIGFEPPQFAWMQNRNIQVAMQDAKQELVEQKILKPETLTKKIEPLASHAADNYDWRYFSAARLFS